jgi:hypothetical protein
MGWAVKLPDGSLSEPFDTAAEAEAYADEIESRDNRSPEEIWDGEASPRVKLDVFLRRMKMGWKPHRALHTTPDGRYLGVSKVNVGGNSENARILNLMGEGRHAQLHTAMGRSRTIAQWSITSGISEDGLRSGATRHGSLEKYFRYVGWYPSKPRRPMEMTDDDFR